MNNKNLLILSSVAFASTLAITTPVYAQTANTQQNRETIVERLMKAFKLNEGEVNKVVTDYRTERQAERTKIMEERLNQLVEDGKITNDQKTKILAKHMEMQANRPSREEMQNMTKEERMAKNQAHRAELEEWAEANGIDMQYLMMQGRGNQGYGMGGGKFMRGQNSQ